MNKTGYFLLVSIFLFLLWSEKGYAYSLVFTETMEHGLVQAFVDKPGRPGERWKFVATTQFGDSIIVEHDVQTSSSFVQLPEIIGSWEQVGSNEPTGWNEFVSGDLIGFYSDSDGRIINPPPVGGGAPPTIVRGYSANDERWNALDALARELQQKSYSEQTGRSYLGCVGSVASTIGGTIFGAQHHASNVRGFRAGTVARSAVRASGVALGAVVVGGAAASAAVCLGVFFTL